jgi:glycine/D-amino acid oxidase-like deaminating enzyme
LIIGDSHHYGSDPSPFNAEQVDDWMIELAEQTLGCKVQVVERWQGVYGSRGPGPFSFLRPEKGLGVALMHSGVGMSVGPAMAERNVATVLGEI